MKNAPNAKPRVEGRLGIGTRNMKEWRVVINVVAETADEAADAAAELLNIGGEPYSVAPLEPFETTLPKNSK